MKHKKLSNDVDRGYVMECQDNVVRRIQNLDAVESSQKRARMQKDRAELVTQVRSTFRPFKKFTILQEWLAMFLTILPRYPFLVFLGRSRVGKTELLTWRCQKMISLGRGLRNFLLQRVAPGWYSNRCSRIPS